MKERLGRPRAHSKACAGWRKLQTAKPKKCLCGKERWLWMYQGGDVLALNIRGQVITVAYAWDFFTLLAGDKPGAIVKKVTGAGCEVRITDTLGPTLWLPSWTPVKTEVRLYKPKQLSNDNTETDPLKH